MISRNLYVLSSPNIKLVCGLEIFGNNDKYINELNKHNLVFASA